MYTVEDGSQVKQVPPNYNGWLVTKYGSKYWYRNGKYHRLESPACELADGDKFWYQHGKLHRLDGPAVEGANGSKRMVD